METGIGLPNPIPGAEGPVMVEWARRADEAGFSSLATIDRIAYPSYESLVSLAASAAVTRRIGLLTNVLLTPTRNPVVLAKAAASVDQISGGRLTLGMAVGGRPDDFEAVGQPYVGRGRRMDEALGVMQRVWAGERLAGSSRPIGPPPTRRDGIPLLIGGSSERSIERAVRFGIGWTAGGAPPEQVGPLAEKVRDAWAVAGREGKPRIVALAYFALGDRAKEGAASYIKDYYAYLGPYAEAIAQGVPTTAEAVRDVRHRFEDVGVDELIFDPTIADVRQVDLLSEVLR